MGCVRGGIGGGTAKVNHQPTTKLTCNAFEGKEHVVRKPFFRGATKLVHLFRVGIGTTVSNLKIIFQSRTCLMSGIPTTIGDCGR